jgi:outer membrane protease
MIRCRPIPASSSPGGRTNNGHMNDEDFVIPFTPTFLAAYSNTLSSMVSGNIGYGVIDGGFDVLRGPGYKVGLFAGYFHFHQDMNAFGCTPIASVNCTPAVPTSGSAGITEDDQWSALRIGIAGETMLSERIKLSGEVAYLPWAKFTSTDNHFFGNTGMLAETFAGSGNGRGVQLEALLSYYLTPQFSIGVGGRYWAMWTTDATVSCTFGAVGLCGTTPTPPQFFKAVTEQAGVMVQASYRFDSAGALVVK